MYGMIDAIYALRPGVRGFTLKGNDYSGLEWKNDTHTKPTEEEINQKIAELNDDANNGSFDTHEVISFSLRFNSFKNEDKRRKRKKII